MYKGRRKKFLYLYLYQIFFSESAVWRVWDSDSQPKGKRPFFNFCTSAMPPNNYLGHWTFPSAPLQNIIWFQGTTAICGNIVHQRITFSVMHLKTQTLSHNCYSGRWARWKMVSAQTKSHAIVVRWNDAPIGHFLAHYDNKLSFEYTIDIRYISNQTFQKLRGERVKLGRL